MAQGTTAELTYLSRVLKYISNNVFPVLMVPVTIGVFYVYGAVRDNAKDISYAKKDIERISKEFHGRIMANQISIREVGNKVTEIETSVPLILQGISDIQEDVKGIRKDFSKMDVTMGILKDRENRRDLVAENDVFKID